MPSLNQFGAILTFAIDLESSFAKLYQTMAEEDGLSEHKTHFEAASLSSNKRKKNIERSRRENVTEITLEPIEGLDASNYDLNFDMKTLENTKINHEKAMKFYEDAGDKLNVLETKRIFSRCLREHSKLHSN